MRFRAFFSRSSAVGSALRSGRRGRAFESPLLDEKVRFCRTFSLRRGDKRLCLGALPLKYPAAPGLSPSDRPPPFALVRSFQFLVNPLGPVEKNRIFYTGTPFLPPTRTENLAKPLQVDRFLPYLSRKTHETSTGHGVREWLAAGRALLAGDHASGGHGKRKVWRRRGARGAGLTCSVRRRRRRG